MANIKSQVKRNKTNERRRQRNQSIRSSLRTAIRNFREAVAGGDKDKAAELLVSTSRDLDKAVAGENYELAATLRDQIKALPAEEGRAP